MGKEKCVWGLLRIAMGFIFLWAFFDKTFGLGFSTPPNKSWLAGVSPTYGFLTNAVHGPFASFYHSIAGNGLVDWLFMLGLLFVGLTLISGIVMKIGGWSGIAMLFLMFTAISLPPANNPLFDEHLIYIIIITGLLTTNAGDYWGLGKWWSNISFVKKFKFLR